MLELGSPILMELLGCISLSRSKSAFQSQKIFYAPETDAKHELNSSETDEILTWAIFLHPI